MSTIIHTHIQQELQASHHPIIRLSDIKITGAELRDNKIWWVNENEKMTITAIMLNKVVLENQIEIEIPFVDTEMSTPVEEIVDGKAVRTLRFKAQILTNVPEVGDVSLNLPLKFPTGNFLISARRLNLGLEEIKAPFRLAFDDIDIDSLVVVE